MPSPHLRALRTVALALLVGGVTLPAGPVGSGLAAALPLHARLLASSPAEGSSQPSVDEVVLGFSEEVNPSFVAVTVEGPRGDEVAGPPEVDGRSVAQALRADLPAGEHVVTFRVVSADGHPVSGTLTFTTNGGATPSPATSTASPAASPSAAGTATSTASVTGAAPTTPAGTGSSGTLPIWVALGAVALAVAVTLSVGHGRRRSRDPHAGAADATSRDPGPAP